MLSTSSFGLIFLVYFINYFMVWILYGNFIRSLNVRKICEYAVCAILFAMGFVALGIEAIAYILVVLIYNKWTKSSYTSFFLIISCICVVIINDDLTIFLVETLSNFIKLTGNEMIVAEIVISLFLDIVIIFLINKYGLRLKFIIYTDDAIYHYFNSFLLILLFVIVAIHVIFTFIGIADNLAGFFSLVFLLLCSIVGILFFNKMESIRQNIILDEQIRQNQMFKSLVEQVSEYYTSISNFRHDYRNLLSSLEIEIEKTDNKELLSHFHKIIDYSNQRLENIVSQADLITLSKIHDLGIRSILQMKIIKAREKRIVVNIVIEEVPNLDNLTSNTLNTLIRILSILLDNAIEYEQFNNHREINIGFRKVGDCKTSIVIENTIAELNDVNVVEWFNEGFSTKENHSGRGLFIVRKLVDNDSNFSLQTSILDGRVQFILEVINNNVTNNFS